MPTYIIGFFTAVGLLLHSKEAFITYLVLLLIYIIPKRLFTGAVRLLLNLKYNKIVNSGRVKLVDTKDIELSNGKFRYSIYVSDSKSKYAKDGEAFCTRSRIGFKGRPRIFVVDHFKPEELSQYIKSVGIESRKFSALAPVPEVRDVDTSIRETVYVKIIK